MVRLLRNLVIVAALVLGLAFGFLNYNRVTVDLLFRDAQLPLVAVLGCAFVLGVVLSVLLFTGRVLVLKRRLGRTRNQLADARTEIHNLRSMPIHDG
ncbi:MAG: lipopolysaccharide assembly protein LapA domain-containing protein [Salinisphaera sp.]|nr:lipopolysaccharide assembly protein LapA domain-containing protein [Salinisphaera sp.]